MATVYELLVKVLENQEKTNKKLVELKEENKKLKEELELIKTSIENLPQKQTYDYFDKEIGNFLYDQEYTLLNLKKEVEKLTKEEYGEESCSILDLKKDLRELKTLLKKEENEGVEEINYRNRCDSCN